MDESENNNDVNELRRVLMALLPGLALAHSASAQDAAMMQPGSYRIAFENEQLRALDYRSRPGMGVCGRGTHSPPAHLTVVLFDGKVRARAPGGQWRTADGKVGDVFWSEAETHEVENLSGRAIDLEVRERMPVTRDGDDDIEVIAGKVEPAWERWTPDPNAPRERRLRGGYRWKIAVPPSQKKTLRAGYEVKIAGKHELVGGNRRES